MLLTFGQPSDAFSPLDWILLAVGMILLAVILAPVAITACGVLLLRFRPCGDAADIQAVYPTGQNPDYTVRFEELEQLGFRAVGSVYEEMWLYGNDFYKCFPVRLMVSRDGLTYAALYDLGWGGVVRVALDSVTDGGRFIQTAMPGAQLQFSDEEFHRTECPLGPVADLLYQHEQETTQLLQRTGERVVPVSLSERTALDEKIGRRVLSSLGAGGGFGVVALGWGIPLGLAVAVLHFGMEVPWARAIGAAAILAGGAYFFFAFKILPTFHRLLERLEADPPCCRD